VAEELKRDCGVVAELVADRGGVFDVLVDGEKLFSKGTSGRLPEPGEVSRMLRDKSRRTPPGQVRHSCRT